LKNGPIILVEDDADDQEFLIEALTAVGVSNEILVFDNGKKAYDFLATTDKQPFIIISDVNIPIVNGIQLKQEIENNEYLKGKSVPFIFLSTTSDTKTVKEAFSLNCQGFFVKENTYAGIQLPLRRIIEYWKNSSHPI
jgi:CheY-like chemotaxis protein